MKHLLFIAILIISTCCHAQINDFNQLYALGKSSESDFKRYISENHFSYLGVLDVEGIKSKVWSYKSSVDGDIEGGLGYLVGESKSLVLIYITLDPSFLVSAYKQMDSYGYVQTRKVEKPNNDITTIHKCNGRTVVIRLYKEHHRRIIMFILSKDSDLKVFSKLTK